ncbi:hypothetical protein HGRIS_006146 [Hohenbuehelia grisea]|uniref:Tyrosine specific protein phosphatases domain-containing protein n=1 Tax=Hohenbuehelia grisea TaxID=104357 RepID=A0ABR3JYZ0_9AGAR
MTSPLDFLDDTTLIRVLGSPPFVTIEGIINTRDVLSSKRSSFPGLVLRTDYLYRSGEPTNITAKGQEQLKALGIKKIFDFRADREIKSFGIPPLQVDGVQLVRVPVATEDVFTADSLAKALDSFRADELRSFLGMYTAFLKSGGPSYEVVLKHIRDNPEEPCLVHCTSGKDRTGILAALIQKLLGVDDDLIIEDYALSSAGLQPAFSVLEKRFKSIPVYKDNWEGVLNMGTSRPETMRGFLGVLEEKFGGAEQYIKDHTSLDDDDIKVIRANLLKSASA